jgi:FMN phosphatase YigB (HAD superfamily)
MRYLLRGTLRFAGVTQEPSECLFLDDSTSNMKAAKAVGWRTVLVGRHARDSGDFIECPHADFAVVGLDKLNAVGLVA